MSVLKLKEIGTNSMHNEYLNFKKDTMYAIKFCKIFYIVKYNNKVT